MKELMVGRVERVFKLIVENNSMWLSYTGVSKNSFALGYPYTEITSAAIAR